MVVFEKEKAEVCRLYKLINMYSVPISSEDQIAFTQLEPAMILLRSLVSDALSIRDSTVEEFLTSLSRDVTDLGCKLEELKPKLLVNKTVFLKYTYFFLNNISWFCVYFHVQDPQFLDINSDFLQVSLLLGDIRISVDELQHLASTYTSYQKKFMVFLYPRSLHLFFSKTKEDNFDYFLLSDVLSEVGGDHVWDPGGVKGGVKTQAAALGLCPRMGLYSKWMENGETAFVMCKI